MPPVKLSELTDFVKMFNKTNPKIKLRIVAADRHRQLVCPVLVRFTIRDIATIFLTLDSTNDSALIVQNATAFAPREQARHFL